MAAKDDSTSIGDLNIIATGTAVEGKISSQGSMRVNGKIVGEIAVSGNLVIGGTGDVSGNIRGKNVTIGGKTKGNIIASEKLVLESKAVVTGDVRASKLVIDEGAIFDGECVMSGTKTGEGKPGLKVEGTERPR